MISQLLTYINRNKNMYVYIQQMFYIFRYFLLEVKLPFVPVCSTMSVGWSVGRLVRVGWLICLS